MVFAGDGDMGELGSRLKGTASLLKPNIGCSGESRGALQEETASIGGDLRVAAP